MALLLRLVPSSSTLSCLLPTIAKPPPFSLLGAAAGRRKASAAAIRARLGERGYPSESAVSDLWRWLSEKGAVSASSAAVVKPGFVPEALGLVAQRDIARNEVVVEVPKILCLDADMVAASEIWRLCAGLRPRVAIALFLLLLREKARAAASPWHPYLNILSSATNSTIFWSEEELAEIQGSTTMGAKEHVESEFTKVETEVIIPNRNLFPWAITLLDFMWVLIDKETMKKTRDE